MWGLFYAYFSWMQGQGVDEQLHDVVCVEFGLKRSGVVVEENVKAELMVDFAQRSVPDILPIGHATS